MGGGTRGCFICKRRGISRERGKGRRGEGVMQRRGERRKRGEGKTYCFLAGTYDFILEALFYAASM